MSDLDKERAANIARNNRQLEAIGLNKNTVTAAIDEAKGTAPASKIAQRKSAVEKENKAPTRRSDRLRTVDEETAMSDAEADDSENESGAAEDDNKTDGDKKTTEEQPWSEEQREMLSQLGIDIKSARGMLLAKLASLKSGVIFLNTRDDIEAWYNNTQAMLQEGLRATLFDNPSVCLDLLDEKVVTALIEHGMKRVDTNALKGALVEAAGLGKPPRRSSTGAAGSYDTVKAEGRFRMPLMIMERLVKAIGEDNLASVDAFRQVPDRKAIYLKVAERFGKGKIRALLMLPQNAPDAAVCDRLEKSAKKRASNNEQAKRKKQKVQGYNPAGEEEAQAPAEAMEERAAQVAQEEPAPAGMWPNLPDASEEETAAYRGHKTHAKYLIESDLSDTNGVVLAGSKHGKQWEPVIIGAGLLLGKLDTSMDRAKVLMIGRNDIYRGTKVYLPPLTAGGSFEAHTLVRNDLARFKQVDWPVTGLLPGMMGLTGVKAARAMMGLDSESWKECLAEVEKARG